MSESVLNGHSEAVQQMILEALDKRLGKVEQKPFYDLAGPVRDADYVPPDGWILVPCAWCGRLCQANESNLANALATPETPWRRFAGSLCGDGCSQKYRMGGSVPSETIRPAEQLDPRERFAKLADVKLGDGPHRRTTDDDTIRGPNAAKKR